MKQIVVVGDMKTGKDGDTLITHALGSCLGLMIYDPTERVGGLLHAMLPMSRINPEKAQANPYMFVDTGVPRLFREVYRLGGKKNRMIIKAAGCGKPLGNNEFFKIGDRNFTVLKKLLWKNNVILDAQDVGGGESRTVHFDISTGHVMLSTGGTKREL